MSLIIFEDVEIEIIENSKFVFTQTTNEVAKAYFGEPKTVQQAELFAKQIRQTRLNNKQEFIENKHFFYTYDNKNRKTIVWTKNGIVRLGFFIKSERAKKFRDWAEDYIVNQKSLVETNIQIELSELRQEIKDLKKQLILKEDENPFKGFYGANWAFRKRENEYAYSRKDWMLLLNECERTLVTERQNRKYKQLLISGASK
ncbi:hypothetical protein AB0W38_04220 [Aliarcobacter butzleri]|uniref:hypothetical protein n=1 Tax=Aliarcobacter butzleri TaxID=28197 RepID=UPI00344C80C1